MSVKAFSPRFILKMLNERRREPLKRSGLSLSTHFRRQVRRNKRGCEPSWKRASLTSGSPSEGAPSSARPPTLSGSQGPLARGRNIINTQARLRQEGRRRGSRSIAPAWRGAITTDSVSGNVTSPRGVNESGPLTLFLGLLDHIREGGRSFKKWQGTKKGCVLAARHAHSSSSIYAPPPPPPLPLSRAGGLGSCQTAVGFSHLHRRQQSKPRTPQKEGDARPFSNRRKQNAHAQCSGRRRGGCSFDPGCPARMQPGVVCSGAPARGG